MKVAIIGTGNVGSAIGGTLARAGHDVVFAARDQDEVQHVAENAGAKVAASPAAAVTAADVAILAVPWGAIDDVTKEIRDASDDTVVVDVTNPLTSDYSGLATSGGPVGGGDARQAAPARPRRQGPQHAVRLGPG